MVSGITEAMLFPDFDGFARLRGVGVTYTQLSYYEYTDLAKEQFDIANYNEAIDYCNRAIDQDPNYAETYYLRGLAKHHQEQYSSAIADFGESISRNPNYTEAYYYRAEAIRLDLEIQMGQGVISKKHCPWLKCLGI